jgi:hypothetical protein
MLFCTRGALPIKPRTSSGESGEISLFRDARYLGTWVVTSRIPAYLRAFVCVLLGPSCFLFIVDQSNRPSTIQLALEAAHPLPVFQAVAGAFYQAATSRIFVTLWPSRFSNTTRANMGAF